MALPAVAADKRVALVVGVSDYRYSPKLTNPKNDAEDMARALRGAGFDVTQSLDSDRKSLGRTLEAFYQKAQGARTALFFYAGHGIQLEGVNYLVPRDARLRNEIGVKGEAVALQDIIKAIKRRARTTLVFLDACRDNPLAEQLQRSLMGGSRSAAVPRGLAPMNARPDTLMVFAASPGRTAADGSGRNSPFTAALLKHMAVPDVEIETMMKRVTSDVHAATKGAQTPERLSRLTSEFWFKKSRFASWSAMVKPAVAARSKKVDACAVANPPIKCLWRGK
jgi:uncharacterized caspase-like protein